MNGRNEKAPQRMNARIRHMPQKHSAYSNSTCTLRAPFLWHTTDSLFYLCRARKVRTRTTKERSSDNPSILIKESKLTQFICVS